MADRVARIKGVALIPGVSRNGRLYTKELIGNAVARMQRRISSGGEPITVANSHGAADPVRGNATDVVGRVTNVWQDAEGRAHYEADIADTSAGRDVASLLTASTPYIGPVSIRGSFLSDPERVTVKGPDGSDVEAWTASDMEIDGIDFTNKPGVPGSRVEWASLTESVRPANCYEVLESAEAEVYLLSEHTTTEVVEGGNAKGDGKLPYGHVPYADTGYRKDGQKRYPIDTKAHVRAAWAYINTKKDSSFYTSAQLKRIKSRIKAAARKFGIQITESIDELAADLQPIIEAYIEDNEDLAEAYASSSIETDSGSIRVGAYTADNDKTAALAQRVAAAAIAACNALDPDHDGDVDVSPPARDVTHGDDTEELVECSACNAFVEAVSKFCPECGASTTAESDDAARTESEAADVADAPISGAATSPAHNTTEGAGAREENTVTEGTQAPASFTSEQLQKAVSKAVAEATAKAVAEAEKAARKAARKATKKGVAESAAKAAKSAKKGKALSEADIKAKALEEARREVAAELRNSGAVGRKGLAEPPEGLKEAYNSKELAEMDQDSFNRYAGEAFAMLGEHAAGSELLRGAPRVAALLAGR